MAKDVAVKPGTTGKKRTADKDEKPQAERFKETARLVGVDESGESFEKAMAKILKSK